VSDPTVVEVGLTLSRQSGRRAIREDVPLQTRLDAGEARQWDGAGGRGTEATSLWKARGLGADRPRGAAERQTVRR
jgi:hypothetical protein